MAWGFLSHSLVEPSMSVNRKVTVPVGGTLISSAASFRRLYYKAPVLQGTTLRLRGEGRLDGVPDGTEDYPLADSIARVRISSWRERAACPIRNRKRRGRGQP